jgi:hypothetical protein
MVIAPKKNVTPQASALAESSRICQPFAVVRRYPANPLPS